MSMPPPPPPPPPGGFPPAPPPPPPGYVGYDARPAAPFAGWGSRAIGAIVNGIISSVFTAPGRLVSGDAPALGLLLTLAGTIAWIVIYAKQVGSTGQAWGHKVAGVRIVDANTGQVIGTGRAVGRYFATILSALPCLLGYLWPLWDAKKQTFHDKIVNTYSVTA